LRERSGDEISLLISKELNEKNGHFFEKNVYFCRHLVAAIFLKL